MDVFKVRCGKKMMTKISDFTISHVVTSENNNYQGNPLVLISKSRFSVK